MFVMGQIPHFYSFEFELIKSFKTNFEILTFYLFFSKLIVFLSYAATLFSRINSVDVS